MTTTRTVTDVGDVWQEGPSGDKLVGRIHVTAAGRFNVVMCGRKRTPRSLVTFAEARDLALAWSPPDAAEQAIFDAIVSGRHL